MSFRLQGVAAYRCERCLTTWQARKQRRHDPASDHQNRISAGEIASFLIRALAEANPTSCPIESAKTWFLRSQITLHVPCSIVMYLPSRHASSARPCSRRPLLYRAQFAVLQQFVMVVGVSRLSRDRFSRKSQGLS